MNTEIIGFISGMIGSLSILPQIHKSWKSGSSDDLSTNTIILAVIYGIMIQQTAIYVTNIFSCTLYVILHGIKIYNTRKKNYKNLYINIETETETEIETGK